MDDITGVLRDLAAGRIGAAEAQRLIDTARGGGAAANPDSADDASSPDAGSPDAGDDAHVVVQASPVVEEATEDETPRNSGGVERVQVRASGRRIRLVGDPEVGTLIASGPHELRRVGSRLEVTSDGELGGSLRSLGGNLGSLGNLGAGLGSLGALGALGGLGTRLKTSRSLDDLRDLGSELGSQVGSTLGLGEELVLRVNPTLVVDLEMTAGTLTSTGVPRFGSLRITAASATIAGLTRVDEVLVQAATATVGTRLTGGRSRVRVESGHLTLALDAGSDVSVEGEAQMGRIAWPGDHGSVDEYVVGEGMARVDLHVVMGQATVRDQAARQHTDDDGSTGDSSADEGADR